MPRFDVSDLREIDGGFRSGRELQADEEWVGGRQRCSKNEWLDGEGPWRVGRRPGRRCGGDGRRRLREEGRDGRGRVFEMREGRHRGFKSQRESCVDFGCLLRHAGLVLELGLELGPKAHHFGQGVGRRTRRQLCDAFSDGGVVLSNLLLDGG